MITDAQNRPSNQQSLVGSGTIVSTDSIDLLTANRNVGRSFPMRMAAYLTSALVGAGTAVRAELITSANANLTSPTIIATGATVAVANAAAGTEILDAPIPGTAQRYLGVQYVLTGTTTGGAVTAVLVSETDNQPYIAMNTGL